MMTRLNAAERAKKLIPVALLFSVLGVAACNTVEGAGQDIQAGGRAIEDTAEDVKN
ncbi:entericidin A/B family lipoprotein [Indioceanicola profundi]|uniref:entericidin A/B family lipoprotein n=1 Tax=Indioceanicola profundi TaxID=2220096 RepID=UPI00298DFBD3|nr:entericidin A/B family lipoprotein [Indioceanicola profundi]